MTGRTGLTSLKGTIARYALILYNQEVLTVIKGYPLAMYKRLWPGLPIGIPDRRSVGDHRLGLDFIESKLSKRSMPLDSFGSAQSKLIILLQSIEALENILSLVPLSMDEFDKRTTGSALNYVLGSF